LNSISLPHN